MAQWLKVLNFPQHGADPESRKKVKVLFYHAGGQNNWLYPTALHFKTYVETVDPALGQHLDWLIPLQQEISDEELIAKIWQSKVDVLCTSHYLWNHDFFCQQLSRVRPHLPAELIIIGGGPSIDVNKNSEFFNQHPYFDYAVYAAGEQAFVDILQCLIFGKPLLAVTTSNCAWKDPVTAKTHIAGYKFVPMLGVSPFVHNQEMFADMVSLAKQQHQVIWLPYMLTRGCPYSCTFCDWNSGLGNKVSRRKNTYVEDIDLFHKLGLTHIFLSDANVGQYQEDVAMIEYFAEKNIKHDANFYLGGSYSKLHKQNNLKIFHVMAKSGLTGKTFNFSIQDVDETVLQNIDRPDVGWQTHRVMAQELISAYPHMMVKAQLIYALPGQTVASWRNTLRMITKEFIIPVVFLNHPLPTSPAMLDPEYQKKFNFEYVDSQRLLGVWQPDVKESQMKWYLSCIPKSSSSFDQKDIVIMNLLNAIYTAGAYINIYLIKHSMPPIDIEIMVDSFLQSKNYENLFDNLLYNWTRQNKFIFTQKFSGQHSYIFDDGLAADMLGDKSFLQFVVNISPAETKKTLAQSVLNGCFQKYYLEIQELD